MACISLILLVRHRRQGEVAAWFAAIILTGLTAYWCMYGEEVMSIQDTSVLNEAQRSNSWYTLKDS